MGINHCLAKNIQNGYSPNIAKQCDGERAYGIAMGGSKPNNVQNQERVIPTLYKAKGFNRQIHDYRL